MIVTMRSTSAANVANRLVKLRQEGGVVALGRVLTLIILPSDEETAERAIRQANEASQEHPSRVIVVQPHLESTDEAGIDAQIRVGGDAGASEVIVLRPYGPTAESTDTLVMPLLLPDAPIVAWWPGVPDEPASATPVGAIAQRRITYVVNAPDGPTALEQLAASYSPGDSDLSWAGITLWRGVIAAALEETQHEHVSEVRVTAEGHHPCALLLAGWMVDHLDCRATVTPSQDDAATGITRVEIDRPSGTLVVSRPGQDQVATLSRPSKPDQEVNLARRGIANSLREELRRLDEDVVYGRALVHGVPRVELQEG